MQPSSAVLARAMAPGALENVPRLVKQAVEPGERWIFSAGFNVRKGQSDMGRVDCELEDLDYLLSSGARVAILSHQGSYKNGTAESLEFLADYISVRLKRSVAYCSTSSGEAALEAVSCLSPGDVVLLGNTRFHAGEERNDPALAEAFSRLGDKVAVGGFSKAHREHASNVGILKYRPGFATNSLLDAVRDIEPWAGIAEHKLSVAVLGGIKKEKTVIGLAGFAQIYDAVIPAGAVLNCCLVASGYEVGDSHLGERSDECIDIARNVLRGPHGRKVLLPEELIVARKSDEGFFGPHVIRVGERIAPGHAIVDFLMSDVQSRALDDVVSMSGRLLVAGTPCLAPEGFTAAGDACVHALSQPGVTGILMGGDSCSDLSVDTRKSTGGGSCLQFLVEGDSSVLRALRDNAERFRGTA